MWKKIVIYFAAVVVIFISGFFCGNSRTGSKTVDIDSTEVSEQAGSAGTAGQAAYEASQRIVDRVEKIDEGIERSAESAGRIETGLSELHGRIGNSRQGNQEIIEDLQGLAERMQAYIETGDD